MALAHTTENKMERIFRRSDLFGMRRLKDDWAAYWAIIPAAQWQRDANKERVNDSGSIPIASPVGTLWRFIKI